MNDDNDIVEREGYRLVLEPLIGLTRFCMTAITSVLVIEVLRTEQGRTAAAHALMAAKASIHTFLYN